LGPENVLTVLLGAIAGIARAIVVEVLAAIAEGDLAITCLAAVCCCCCLGVGRTAGAVDEADVLVPGGEGL
jgi:hypothetical protein